VSRQAEIFKLFGFHIFKYSFHPESAISCGNVDICGGDAREGMGIKVVERFRGGVID
jgi:hypothetical protein